MAMDEIYKLLTTHTWIKKAFKYSVMFFLLYTVKMLLKYLTKRAQQPETIESERSKTAPDNAPIDISPDNGLFDDKMEVEKSEKNYYYDVYLKNEEDKKHIPFSLPRFPKEELLIRSNQFYEQVNKRRSCRFFSSEPVSKEVIEKCVLAAGTAPSGAHSEPWHFVVVYNQEDKQIIRELVEEEEQINYERRMGAKWLSDLAKIKTTFVKEYISEAPAIILVFKVPHHVDHNNVKHNNWYYEASVSISVGILLCALNNVGLVTVTSTPMNCGPALRRLVERPEHEKLAFLLPVGYPSDTATVPDLVRKPFSQICTLIE